MNRTKLNFDQDAAKADDRLDGAETNYARNRLRDDPRLEKVAKARLAAKGKYGSGGNRRHIQQQKGSERGTLSSHLVGHILTIIQSNQ